MARYVQKACFKKNSMCTESNIACQVVYFIYKYSKGEMKMRFFEMASAQEQLALWRLISDNTWAAVEQQASEEAARKAQQKPIAKVGKKSAVLKVKPKPVMRLQPPAQKPTPPAQKPTPPAQKPTPTTPPKTPTSIAAKPAVNFQPPAVGTANNAVQPEVEPFKRLISAGSLVKNGQEKTNVAMDDRHSKDSRRQ